jgi:LasA protease
MRNAATVQISGHVLSNGQFVYGPNVGGFDLKTYLRDHAPHLVAYADDLYGRSEYFSINPRVYLTLLEIHANLVSSPDVVRIENPFDLPGLDFIAQIEYISEIMSDAYYLHLYSYSSLPVSQRQLPSLNTQNGDPVEIASDTNAGTYAILAVLSKMESQANLLQLIDNNHPNGFYQTYIKLFGSDDPLDETNHIDIPGEPGAFSTRADSAASSLTGGAGAANAPADLLQLPYLRGQSWFFGGVHSNGSGGVQSPFTDGSALDFGPGGVAWGGDTSTMWVVASASGIPTKISNCYFSILHADGWETTYYHIENIQNFSGAINQNDKIGVIANTLAEAICSGGSATGPHVHFNLKHNGALVAINGTSLSGWYVHAGRWNTIRTNYMWLEKDAEKYANTNKLLSEALQSQFPAMSRWLV